MPYTAVDDVAIWFEEAGDPRGEPLVLVSGFGAQLIWWREAFCTALGAAGYRVIRMDNRDVGRSQLFGGPEDLDGGYDHADMADDVVRVLDTLDVPAAHVAGHSKGGQIAQELALAHPGRVRSLALIGTLAAVDPRYLLADLSPALAVPQPRLEREPFVAGWLEWARSGHVGSHALDEAWVRTMAERHYDRGYAPDGQPRQWAAALRSPELLPRLDALAVPTVVIHGRLDPAVHWSAAVDLAEAIDDAELVVLADMGHEMPRQLWRPVVEAISRNARRAAR